MKQPKRTYDEMNLVAARHILDAPERFGGVDGFPACWARLFMKRLENERRVVRNSTYDAPREVSA